MSGGRHRRSPARLSLGPNCSGSRPPVLAAAALHWPVHAWGEEKWSVTAPVHNGNLGGHELIQYLR